MMMAPFLFFRLKQPNLALITSSIYADGAGDGRAILVRVAFNQTYLIPNRGRMQIPRCCCAAHIHGGTTFLPHGKFNVSLTRQSARQVRMPDDSGVMDAGGAECTLQGERDEACFGQRTHEGNN